MNARTRIDRRWGPRIAVDLPVRLTLARGHSENGRMRNVSMSGALIECALEMPVFTPLRIEIRADGGAARQIEIAARVVRAEHPQIGVEWREFEPPALKALLDPGQ